MSPGGLAVNANVAVAPGTLIVVNCCADNPTEIGNVANTVVAVSNISVLPFVRFALRTQLGRITRNNWMFIAGSFRTEGGSRFSGSPAAPLAGTADLIGLDTTLR